MAESNLRGEIGGVGMNSWLGFGYTSMVWGLALCAITVPLLGIAQLLFRERLGVYWMIICATITTYAAGIMVFTLFPLRHQEPFSCSRDPLRTIPFHSFAEVLDLASGQSFTATLMSSQFLQIVCNILLFMPLGFLARAVFKRSLLGSTLLATGFSLAIELTQLTGIWGMYDCAYRIFDVDDLITNTAGGLLGAVVALAWISARRREERPLPTLGAKR